MEDIKLSREFFLSDLWTKPREYSRCEAWLDLVRTDGEQSSVRTLASRWRWGTHKVRGFLEYLESQEMITLESDGKNIITITKYAKQKGHTLGHTLGHKKGTDNEIGISEMQESRAQKGHTLGHTLGHTSRALKKKNETLARRQEFYNALVPYLDKYPKETIRAFYDYWSELNKSGSKMRYEMQKTWELPLRLATWANREKVTSRSEIGRVLTDISTEEYKQEW